jgi:DNA invertase Pin-like site-specific DNA recombinase
MLQQMAAVAELEAGLISTRTKAALAAAKARGKKLGGNRGVSLSSQAREAGRAELIRRAKAHATDLGPTIAEIRHAGTTSLRGIAAALNARRIPTARGRAKWSAVQVGRAPARL